MEQSYPLQSQAAKEYVKFAQDLANQRDFESQRKQQLLLQQAQDRELAIQKGENDALTQIDKNLESLPESARNGRGVVFDTQNAKNWVKFQGELNRIDPAEKGAEQKISILKAKYNPDQLTKPYESTDEYKAALARKVKIEDDFKVVNVLRDQVGVVGKKLAQAKLLENQGGEENIKQARFVKDEASQYALQNVTQTLQGAVTANAEQLNEVLRKADALMSPFKQYQQGAKLGAVTAGVVDRIMKSKPGSPERESSVSSLVDSVKNAISSDPEAWYRSTRTAIEAYTKTENDAKKTVFDAVGPWHASKMGIRQMQFKDPLAEVENIPAAVPPMYGGVQSVSTGEMGAAPISSGSAGMTPSRQAMPTSTSPIKFRYVTSP